MGVILSLSRVSRCREPESVFLLLGFIRSENFVSIGSQVRITWRNHTTDCISTGLTCLDCSGVTTENSAICVFSLIRYGDSIVLVTLTAILLSDVVNIEWEISKRAVSLNFCNGVTVTVVFHFDRWPTKTVIVFGVVGGIIKAFSVMTGWVLRLFHLRQF